MGISGLQQFCGNTATAWSEVTYSSSSPSIKLAIDGYALMNFLYADIPWRNGGMYGTFARKVESFMRSLKKCNINPIIVFDGVRPENSRYNIQREEDRISRVFKAFETRESIYAVLPVLLQDVFMETIRSQNVQFVVADTDAESAVVWLARQNDCPALSYDVAFYLFDLPQGYISLDNFKVSDAQIKAKVFHPHKFAEEHNIKHELLPAFAALASNEVHSKQSRFLNYCKKNFSTVTSHTNKRIVIFNGLMGYLTQFNTCKEALNAAYDAILPQIIAFEDQEENGLSKEDYDIAAAGNDEDRKQMMHAFNCIVARFTPSDEEHLGNDSSLTLPPTVSDEPLLPKWLHDAFRRGDIPSWVMTVLILNHRLLPTLMESQTDDSVWDLSRSIRSQIYGILFAKVHEAKEDESGNKNWGDEETINIMEFARENDKIRSHHIEPQWTTSGEDPFTLPHLLELPSLDEVMRAEVITKCLEGDSNLPEMDEEMKLLALAFRHWIRAVYPKVWEVIAMIAMFSTTPESTGTKLLNQKPKLPKTDVAHLMSTWEAILHDTISLNRLCGTPLPLPAPHQMYDGRVAHQMLYRCSRMHMTPDHISSCGHGAEAGDDANPIEDILSSIKADRSRFRYICDHVLPGLEESIEEEFVDPNAPAPAARGQRAKAINIPGAHVPCFTSNNAFASILANQEAEEEEEVEEVKEEKKRRKKKKNLESFGESKEEKKKRKEEEEAARKLEEEEAARKLEEEKQKKKKKVVEEDIDALLEEFKSEQPQSTESDKKRRKKKPKKKKTEEEKKAEAEAAKAAQEAEEAAKAKAEAEIVQKTTAVLTPEERAAKLAAMKNKAGKSKAKAEALRKAKEEKAKELKKEKKEKAKEEQEAKNPDQKKRGGRL